MYGWISAGANGHDLSFLQIMKHSVAPKRWLKIVDRDNLYQRIQIIFNPRILSQLARTLYLLYVHKGCIVFMHKVWSNCEEPQVPEEITAMDGSIVMETIFFIPHSFLIKKEIKSVLSLR